MHAASVGFQCPECAADRATKVVTARGLQTFQPVVTITLIALNVAVWVIGQVLWRATNLLDTSNGALVRGGLLASALEFSSSTGRSVGMIGVAEGEWYRLVTSGFMHAGIFHLGINMWALWILGQVTERALGRSQTVMVYLVALISGSFGALLVSPDVLTVGASGAIFGLMGGLLVVAKARGIALRDTGLLGVLGINLVLTFMMAHSLSVGGHIGGLIGGALGAFVVVTVPTKVTALNGARVEVYRWVASAVVFVLIAVAAVAVAQTHAGARDTPGVVASAPVGSGISPGR